MTDSQRVLILAGLLATAAGLIAWRWLWSMSALPGYAHLGWWMPLVGFAAADVVFDIHLDIRRDTYTVSLMEIPLVMGLFLVSPVALVFGRLLGAGAALALYRRQSPLKLVFNLSLFALESSIAVLIFRGLVASGPATTGSATWGAAFAASLAANGLSAVAVTSVIALHGGTSRWRDGQFIGAVLIPPVANTSLALGSVTLLQSQPEAVWLLGAIAAMFVITYRGYAALTQRYTNLQRLYEFTGAVQDAPQGEGAVVPMLEAARTLLRARTAELAVVNGDDDKHVLVTTVGAENAVSGRRVPIMEMGTLWMQALESGASVRGVRNSKDEVAKADLATQGRKDVLIVPIRRRDAVLGTMMVADREGDVASFDRDDLRFFETVVNHAAVALEKSRLVERLEHEALHDSLTGLPNRALFNSRVLDAIRRRVPGTKSAVMLMDLDRFKEVNDTLGHHHGDRLLREVGARLSTQLFPDVTIARLGGDEFAILIRNLADGESALRVAGDIRDLVNKPFVLDELAVDIGASVGVALCPDHGEDPATLLQRADVAMYAAKAAAGVEIYASERDQYSPRRLALVAELRQAIDDGVLEVYYQPKAEIASGRVVGVEALLRWPHPEYGFVPPDEFIKVAEHTALIRPLTHYVVSRAIRQCRVWQDAGIDLQMSVNLSVRNLLDFDLTRDVVGELDQHGVDPSLLTLEITESSFMGDPARTVGILNGLAEIGIRLSVDDFGTGYSSMAYLNRLPVSEVKIDKSFVQGMATDPSDAAIVRSIVDLGANLGLDVVAEGVEDQATWEVLENLGCFLAQGYYLSRALPADDLVEWLEEHRSESTVRSIAALRSPRALFSAGGEAAGARDGNRPHISAKAT